jgi:LPS-assembly protein
VPFRDQSQLPNFTTAERDFNFAQIFTENRFVGGDRIGDANQLTIALTSRLIETETGLERFRAALGQVYYFRPPRVTLGAASTRRQVLRHRGARREPDVAVGLGRPGLQYTPNLSRSQKLTLEAHYCPSPAAS